MLFLSFFLSLWMEKVDFSGSLSLSLSCCLKSKVGREREQDCKEELKGKGGESRGFLT